MIPVYKPYITNLEKKYVNEALDTGWLSANGPFVRKFEESFSKYIGSNYVSTVCNGTAGLETCVRIIQLNHKNKKALFLIPNLCYIAVPNSIKNSGSSFIVGDIDENHMGLSFSSIEKEIKYIDAILYVHNYSFINPEMQAIRELCDENNVVLVEDACEAFGSKIKNKYLGTFGHMGVFSFFGNKTITTGEGGMIVTDDISMHDRVGLLKSHGTKAGASIRDRYNHVEIGHNFRMTNLQAAIGCAQLENAEDIIKKKNFIFEYYMSNINKKYLFDVSVHKDVFCSNWLFCIKSDQRYKMMDYLLKNDIETRSFFKTVLEHRFHQYTTISNFTNSLNVSRVGINIPSYPELTIHELQHICNAIKRFDGDI